MKSCKLFVTVLVLLACAWLPAPVQAAEPSGPATLAAPGACPAIAAVLGVPAPVPLFSPAAETAATSICGPCSQAICVGKRLNFICGAARLCQQIGTCAAATVPHCECLAPPAEAR